MISILNDLTNINDLDLVIILNKKIDIKKDNIYVFNDIKEIYKFIKNQEISESTKIGLIADNDTKNLIEFMIYYKNKLQVLTKEIIKFNKTLIDKKDNKIIIDALNKFINLNSDGKFLRGCLIDLGYKFNNKNDDYANDLAIAYETFQTSILIHDDIIDNANLRRGKDTIHYTYQKEFNNFKYQDNTNTSLALCIGDIGFYYSNKLIINKYKNDKNFIKLFDYYNDIVINTIKGEILDVYLPYIEKNNHKNKLEENDILEIYKLKTSYYSVVGPFILGMILSSSSDKDIKEMSDILMNIGISFQIKDDILGIFSNNDTLGKSVCSDIEEFKQTILYSYIKINKKDYYKELLKYYGKNNITENELKKVQDIIISSGSLEYAKNKMNELSNYSKEKLNNLNINNKIKNILLGLIIYLDIREK